MKKLTIIGEIDHDLYATFVAEMNELESLKAQTIEIELTSDGGDALVALAFYDKILQTKHKTIIVARGLVASAAVIILAAGDTRKMASSAWVMVHEDNPVFNEGAKVTEIEKEAKHARRLEDQWNSLMAEQTDIPAERWAMLHKNETYLTAAECLSLGLIEEII
jgi:ATP-dependent protease ClpP protease subunit